LLLNKKDEKTPDVFWREYEEKTGEKVLARGLGKYVSGWDEFDEKKWEGLWGLIVRTSGGFRFHHFPQNSWIDAFTSFIKAETVKEKAIFIPGEKIVSFDFIKETKWYKRLFCPSPSLFVIRYMREAEKKLVFKVEWGNHQKMFSGQPLP
jgi:hypothetical protein